MREIDKGIQMPTEGPSGATPKYPEFRVMSVGDSVMFEGDYPSAAKAKPCVAARVYGTRSGKRFSGRKVEGGVRIWRVK